ncbi:MAG: RsmE family RNA methyltransferase [Fibrobacterota bacterium]|nr:RsmE family RNA methyltransferase [Fibrobacterota bacterium]
MEKTFEESWFHAPLEAVGDRAILSAEESHHLRKVLRVQLGRCVVASNGAGGVFLCETQAKGDLVELIALDQLAGETVPPNLNLVLSLLKGRDLEEPVEGLCQLPIHAIHIVTTDHTQEFKAQGHGKLVERLRAKSLVALKQAKKAWLTEIHEPIPLRNWRRDYPDIVLILVHPGEDKLPEKPEGPFGVLTGPEGGFSTLELDWLMGSGGYSIGLGTTRIRGTHAPLLACGKLMGMAWI